MLGMNNNNIIIMGAKKKAQVAAQPPPPQPQEKTVNTIITLRSSDNVEFKVGQQLLTRHSYRARSLIDDSSKKDTIILQDYDNDVVQSIVQFLNLHKQKQTLKIVTPIRSNQQLKNVMEEADAQFIERVMGKGDSYVLEMLNVSTYLEIEQLKRRLACGVAMKLMRSTLEQLREEYEIEGDLFNQQELKGQMRAKIQTLKINEDDF